MKQCQKCKRIFEDTAFYCPECGEGLQEYVQTQYQTTVTSNQTAQTNKKDSTVAVLLGQAAEKTAEMDRSDNILIKWLPTLFSIVGFIVCWNWNWLWGSVIAIIGYIYGRTSQNKVNKYLSIIAAVACVLLTLLALAVG